ncbi:MAG: tRNA threonylcarbamoyladenosine biosynthesis protein RimN [Gammaproteobacteria bacterium]|nr:MAG: tRNA threonylcarbamoyladenosine biosynthesis protein RimN [Gammaproteobacteria bacterium]
MDILKTTDPATASQWMQDGKLLAYPTESVWGIGCDAFNEQAVKKILTIKNRPIEKGLIVVTDSIKRLNPILVELSTSQKQTLTDSWQNNDNKQQASTWVLPIPANIKVPSWIIGKHNNIAVRVIAHPLIKQVCKNMVSADNPFGFIVSTSCNPTTNLPATNYNEAFAYFGNDIGYLMGDTLAYTKPSQIKDVVTGHILR